MAVTSSGGSGAAGGGVVATASILIGVDSSPVAPGMQDAGRQVEVGAEKAAGKALEINRKTIKAVKALGQETALMMSAVVGSQLGGPLGAAAGVAAMHGQRLLSIFKNLGPTLAAGIGTGVGALGLLTMALIKAQQEGRKLGDVLGEYGSVMTDAVGLTNAKGSQTAMGIAGISGGPESGNLGEREEWTPFKEWKPGKPVTRKVKTGFALRNPIEDPDISLWQKDISTARKSLDDIGKLDISGPEAVEAAASKRAQLSATIQEREARIEARTAELRKEKAADYARQYKTDAAASGGRLLFGNEEIGALRNNLSQLGSRAGDVLPMSGTVNDRRELARHVMGRMRFVLPDILGPAAGVESGKVYDLDSLAPSQRRKVLAGFAAREKSPEQKAIAMKLLGDEIGPVLDLADKMGGALGKIPGISDWLKDPGAHGGLIGGPLAGLGNLLGQAAGGVGTAAGRGGALGQLGIKMAADALREPWEKNTFHSPADFAKAMQSSLTDKDAEHKKKLEKNGEALVEWGKKTVEAIEKLSLGMQ